MRQKTQQYSVHMGRAAMRLAYIACNEHQHLLLPLVLM